MSNSNSPGGDWNSASESLFRAARADHEASERDRARVRSALGQRIAEQAAMASNFAEGAQPALQKSTSLSRLTWSSLGAVGVIAGSVALMHSFAARPEAARTAQAPGTVAPTARGAEDSARGREVHEGPIERAGEKIPVARPHLQASPRSGPQGTAARLGPASKRSALQSRTRPTSTTVVVSRLPGKTQARDPEVPAASRMRASAVSAETRAKERMADEPQPSEALSADDLSAARAELANVAKIHAAMRRNDPSAALALCAEHEQRWPHGTFSAEREGVRAMASCALHSPDAEQQARAFLAAYPRMPIASSVAKACLAPAPVSRTTPTTKSSR